MITDYSAMLSPVASRVALQFLPKARNEAKFGAAVDLNIVDQNICFCTSYC